MKKRLRRRLITQRCQLSPLDWRDRSSRLCMQIRHQPIFEAAKIVFAYFSIRQEPDLSLLWRSHPGKIWAFPRCVGPNLLWHVWHPGQPLAVGNYGIQEPEPDASRLLLWEADLILVPAVGCDLMGNRLGYGGGYYDRALATLNTEYLSTARHLTRHLSRARPGLEGAEQNAHPDTCHPGTYHLGASTESRPSRPRTLGIVFDFALLQSLPQDNWDYPLDGVCSESRWVECSSGSCQGHDKIETT